MTARFLRTARRWFAALGLAAAAATPALAAYPSQPITLFVPYGAGGTTDQLARALGEALGKRLGQTVVVDNKPGANGTMGVMQLKRARPDGYTLSIIPMGVFRQPYLQQGGVSYDPLKDVTYISQVAAYGYAIAVLADAKWKTIDELVADAKARPGEINYGTSGLFTSNHLAMAELARATGAEMTHVPFKGDAEALSALMGKHIQVVSSTNTVLPFVQSGQMRVLATAGATRPKDFADAPTLQEAGYPVVMLSPIGIGGPAGLPDDIVAKLDGAIADALRDPAFQEMVARFGLELAYADHATYDAWARQTVADEKTIIERLAKEIP
ncbi:tripartite tricarboxylate transporter substrate binding protein [Verticiella sediminum]|uniref:Tripartite tricarboxylate transporter substrate binding protein n=1 Tax=Verticiella sediminum TaxID=1247510 RepID=A0A556B0Y2_9BURK|nr:tripartite tricarboxylate transporter substrate binding protein [Verticiella sediminum]TSH98830.1 tripartite tricarboxylate transporter substrate binding protein [Verticiella sediminum]